MTHIPRAASLLLALRNPQTSVPNIFQAKASDYRAQTHRIYRTARWPSHVEVRVLSPTK
jgi:hypothetical protein